MGRTWVLASLAAAAVVADAAAGSTGTRTSITIWSATQPAAAYGGVTYSGYTPPSGALITEQREVDVSATGDTRIAGVAATVDPASVQLRVIGEAGTTVSEQRFVPGATTPDEILARHIGEAITVVTPKGDVAGTLRSIDAQALVVEVGSGDQRKLQVLRRDGFVQDIHLPAGASVDKPSLAWRLSTKKAGKRTVEVSYRAEGMSWSADYLAVLDDAARTADFSAWATVKNATGATFDDATLTLVSGGGTVSSAPTNPAYMMTPPRQVAAQSRFVVPSPVRIGNGESVQVELMAPRVGAKARSIVTYEAMPDPSANFQQFPGTDCNQLSTPTNTARAEVAIELDVPLQTALPDGRVRLFRRKGDRLEVISEDALRSSPGVARIRLSPDNDVTGERRATSCNADERTRTIHEKVELKLENKGKQGVTVVAREFLWRTPMSKIEPADETPKGTRAGTQTQEYRVELPAGGKKTITYAVSYQW